MLDFAKKWKPVPDWENATVEMDGFSARRLFGLHQILISGTIPSKLRPFGWGPIVRGDDYAIQISRDRVLQVAVNSSDIPFGWQDAGFATSSADDLYAIFELSGDNCSQVFARAANIDWLGESNSACMLFSRLTALVYRYDEETRLRIHVESPYATYFYTWLEQVKLT